MRLTDFFFVAHLGGHPRKLLWNQITGEQLKALEQLQKEGKLPEDPWQNDRSDGRWYFLT